MTNKEKTTIDQLSTGYRSSGHFDVDGGLSRLHRELGIEDRQEATIRSISKQKSYRFWLGIAASLLLVVAIGVAFATSLAQNTYLAQDGVLEVPLPDGSLAILKAGSELSFADSYGEENRAIELIGEAYFSVQPDADHPFLVSQDGVTLRVVGTTFNLLADPEKAVFEVEVSSGKVMLESASESLPVEAKECGRVTQGRKLVKMAAPNLNRHAWQTGQLVFSATPFDEAVTIIERAYDVVIKVSAEDLKQCNFPITASFKDAELEDVLIHLEKLTGGQFLSAKSGNVHRLVEWCD